MLIGDDERCVSVCAYACVCEARTKASIHPLLLQYHCRSYSFLVKGGEDVRGDERVEQLFEAMNTVLAHDPSCRQARLCCRVYKVVPLAPSMGLIEWVPHTTVLKDVLRQGLAAHRKAEAAALASMAAAGAAEGGGSGGTRRTGGARGVAGGGAGEGVRVWDDGSGGWWMARRC